MTPTSPTDPRLLHVLREEIARTRADLGQTVEALAAKTDVKARARSSLGQATGQVKHKIRSAGDQAGHTVSSMPGRRGRASGNGHASGDGRASGDGYESGNGREPRSDREPGSDLGRHAAPVRKHLPMAAIAAAAVALAGLAAYLVRRHRS